MLGFDDEEGVVAAVGELATDDDNAEVDEAATVERANDDVVLGRTGRAVDSVMSEEVIIRLINGQTV